MKKHKVLVVSAFPAPYRVGVFKELTKYYDLETYFDTCVNENRNKDWFCKSGEFVFYVLNNKEAKKKFRKALLNIRKYDFVLAYDPVRKPTMLVIFLCRLLGIPYYINNDGAILRKNIFRDLLKRFLYSGASAGFSSGNSATNYFKYYGLKDNQIFTHDFTSLTKEDIFDAPVSEEKRKELRKELGLQEMTTVITVGQFIHRKGFDILLEAWKKIDDKAQLLLIGGGDERASYEAFVEEHGLKNVKIIDFMPKKEIFRHYCASDIFVLPTREDIWGLVVNEAMAVGLPVVTTDNCVAGLEFIDEDVNGYIVPVGDSSALAEKLLVLVEDESKRREISLNNINKIQNNTIENIAERHHEAIQKTLKK